VLIADSRQLPRQRVVGRIAKWSTRSGSTIDCDLSRSNSQGKPRSLAYRAIISVNVSLSACVAIHAVDWGNSVKSSITKRTAFFTDVKRRSRRLKAAPLPGEGFRQ
jgi:hypothetical protein